MSPHVIFLERRRRIVETEIFDYTRLEYSFMRSNNVDSTRKIIDSSSFKDIDWSVQYKGKNREMYETVGEFFIMVCVKKIFESSYTPKKYYGTSFNAQSRKEMCGWVNVLCLLMKRGYLSREIVERVESYISQKRMPLLLRCVVRLLMKKYLSILKTDIKTIVSKEYCKGVDNIISSYVLF